MTHPVLYFACVFGGLFAVTLALIFIARATNWKPTPIRPVWAVLAVVAADVVAGLVCSYYARDIRVLYWWLIGLPIVTVFIPVTVVATTLYVRLINVAVFSIIERCRHKR